MLTATFNNEKMEEKAVSYSRNDYEHPKELQSDGVSGGEDAVDNPSSSTAAVDNSNSSTEAVMTTNTTAGWFTRCITFYENYRFRSSEQKATNAQPRIWITLRTVSSFTKPIVDKLMPPAKKACIYMDDLIDSIVQKVRYFGEKPSNANSEKLTALSLACEVWFEHHREPGHASVFDFQEELQNRLKNVITPMKQGSHALVDKLLKAIIFIVLVSKIIMLHLQIFILFCCYWLNVYNWKLSTTYFEILKKSFEEPTVFLNYSKQTFQKCYHSVKSVPFNQLSKEMGFQSREFVVDGLGKMLLVTPQAKRKEVYNCYVEILSLQSFVSGGLVAICLRYIHKILLNDIAERSSEVHG